MFEKQYILRVAYFILGVMVVGVLSLRLYQTTRASDRALVLLNDFIGTTVVIEGRVNRITEFDYKTSLRLSDVRIDDVPVGSRRVYVNAPSGSNFVLGDYVRGEGRVTIRQGQAGEYVIINDIESMENVFDVKSSLLKRVYKLQVLVMRQLGKLFPEPHAGIVGGVLFGIEGRFTEELYDTLRKTGVLHVLVASGFNAILVIEFMRIIARVIAPKIEILVILVGVLVYIGIAGFQIPIIRASVMSGGRLWAQKRGDNAEGLLFLLATAYVLLLIKPEWLFSISFQLSFMASLGLIFFASVAHRLPFGSGEGIFAELVLTTLFAQLFTSPIIYIHFQELSIIGLASNPLVLWTIPMIMLGGAIAFVLSLVHLAVGAIVSVPVFLLVEYFLFIIHTLSI